MKQDQCRARRTPFSLVHGSIVGGNRHAGAIYATFMAIISVCASVGPVVAGALFDASQSYSGYLAIVAPMVIVAALLVGWIPLSADEVEQR